MILRMASQRPSVTVRFPTAIGFALVRLFVSVCQHVSVTAKISQLQSIELNGWAVLLETAKVSLRKSLMGGLERNLSVSCLIYWKFMGNGLNVIFSWIYFIWYCNYIVGLKEPIKWFYYKKVPSQKAHRDFTYTFFIHCQFVNVLNNKMDRKYPPKHKNQFGTKRLLHYYQLLYSSCYSLQMVLSLERLRTHSAHIFSLVAVGELMLG